MHPSDLVVHQLILRTVGKGFTSALNDIIVRVAESVRDTTSQTNHYMALQWVCPRKEGNCPVQPINQYPMMLIIGLKNIKGNTHRHRSNSNAKAKVLLNVLIISNPVGGRCSASSGRSSLLLIFQPFRSGQPTIWNGSTTPSTDDNSPNK